MKTVYPPTNIVCGVYKNVINQQKMTTLINYVAPLSRYILIVTVMLNLELHIQKYVCLFNKTEETLNQNLYVALLFSYF